MTIILIVFSAAVSLVCGYFLYGRWLGTKLFSLNATFVTRSIEFRDEHDFVPTPTPIVFGHHFTSIAEQAQLSALRLRSCGAGARHSFGSFWGRSSLEACTTWPFLL